MAKLNVTLKRICRSGYFANKNYLVAGHPLMNPSQARGAALVLYGNSVTHKIELPDKLYQNLSTRDQLSDMYELSEVIKKFLQCTPNEERLISYGQVVELKLVKISGRDIYMLNPLLMPVGCNSGNFHIESIDFLDD